MFWSRYLLIYLYYKFILLLLFYLLYILQYKVININMLSLYLTFNIFHKNYTYFVIFV